MKNSLNGWTGYGGSFDLDRKLKQIAQLEARASVPDFWNDQQNAKNVLKEKAQLEQTITQFEKVRKEIIGAQELFELARIEGDQPVMGEVEKELAPLEHNMTSIELKLILTGNYDRGNCIMEIHSGAGGTESQDWAQMLMRMYLRFAEKNGFKTSIIDLLEGEEAGVKSVTIEISGEYAYGYLKAENGVHRLVRISPFDANKRRHTSFSSVFVLPEIEDSVQVDINEADLRVDTFRSSGAGGQHVNKTDSAIRITHIPTGIVVASQTQRSQHKNRETAMKVLRARLHELERRKKQAEIDHLTMDKKDIGWGNQIRSYVLAPYRMVKDLRTRLSSGNTDAILDGDIMPFIEAYLTKPATATVPADDEDLE